MNKNNGFTLIELLVVIAIIASLATLLMPSVSACMGIGRSLSCRNQLKIVGFGTYQYIQDNNELLPRSTHSAMTAGVMPWGYALSPYMGGRLYTGPGPGWNDIFNGPYRCPEDKRRDRWSYGKSVWFELTSGETGEAAGVADGPTYARYKDVPHPETTILYGELASGSMADHVMAHFWNYGAKPEVDAMRHGRFSGGACNFVYVDGHVKEGKFSDTFDLQRKIDHWDPGKQ